VGEDVFEKICRPSPPPATVMQSTFHSIFQKCYLTMTLVCLMHVFKIYFCPPFFFFLLCREFEIETGQVPGLPLRVPPHIFLSESNPAVTPEHPVDSPSSLMPELAALKGLDQVKIVTKLIKAVRTLIHTDPDADGTSSPPPLPRQLPELAAELYALSARVERPLHADTAASYRSLLRKCKLWRLQSITSPTDPLLPHLNILISIAGGYFRQDEKLSSMWDEEEEDEIMIEEGHDLDDIML